MGSSNAEKAWGQYIHGKRRFTDYATLGGSANAEAESRFKDGYASRDAEVADLTRLLAESRAANGDSEARRAELEAVIEKVRGLLVGTHCGQEDHDDALAEVLAADPSVVLEDRDRENRAIGWDEGFVRGFDQDTSRPDEINPYRGDKT